MMLMNVSGYVCVLCQQGQQVNMMAFPGTATAECILKQGSKGGLHACALWHLPSREYDRKNNSSIAMLSLSTYYVVKDALAMSVPDTHYVMMQWLAR
jgi:hypothetical protein